MMPALMPSASAVAYDRDINKRDPESFSGIFNDEVSRDFYQDLRAYKVGDLVTVNIVETSKANKSASTQTGKSSSIDAGIDSMLGWEGKIKELTSLGNSDARNAFNNSSMLKGSLTNSFNGSGQTSRGDSMTASITARVLDVQPNGNLLIEGMREIRVNSETQIIILSGYIRPVDISPDNTVLSSYIGDAKIQYLGTGAISDKQRPGWLTRAADIIWPF
jgi:flagellar L-ring protein precursor FlgH